MTLRAFVNAKDTNGSLLATRIGYQNNSERREKKPQNLRMFRDHSWFSRRSDGVKHTNFMGAEYQNFVKIPLSPLDGHLEDKYDSL